MSVPRDSLPSARVLGLSELVHLESVGSTMDEAHTRARTGAPAGTLVVADKQSIGRGRGGNTWTSEAGAGLWMTLLERPSDAAMLRVLSLRLGVRIAEALEAFVDGDVVVKWPNDICLRRGPLSPGGVPTAARKLAGILVEARWREQVVEWVAIGVGINLRVAAQVPRAATLREGTTRASLLHKLVPVLRAAVQNEGLLTTSELAQWHSRDLALGQHIVAPVAGIVRGVGADGALLVRPPHAAHDTHVHTGSMIFHDPKSPFEQSAPTNS